MADINYYVDDYIEQGYYVYTADAVIGLGDYFVENYLADGYYQRTGTYFSLTAELVRATYIEGAATLASAFTQSTDIIRLRGFDVAMTSTSTMSATVAKFVGVASALNSSCSMDVTAGVDRRTSVTLSTQANLNAQAAKFVGFTTAFNTEFTQTTSATKTATILLAVSSEFTQTTTALRTAPTGADLTASFTQSTTAVKTATVTPAFDSIASQLTAAFKNATGTILMEPRATLSAVVGVIKQFSTPLIRGAQFNNDNDWLIYTDNDRLPYDIVAGQIISFWMRKERTDNFGYIWNSYLDRSFPPGDKLLVYYIDKQLVFSSTRLTAPNSGVGFVFDNAINDDNDWHHYAIVIRNWSGAFPGNFRANLYRDGVLITSDYETGPSTYGHYNTWFRDNRLGYQTRIALAQLWIGPLYSTSPTSDEQVLALLENFYDNGYVNLGTGVVNGYTPGIYELFDLPNTVHISSNGADISTFYGDYPLQGIRSRFVINAQSVSVLENTVYAEASVTLSATATRLQTTTANLVSTATASIAAVKTSVGASAVASSASLSLDYIRYRNVDSTVNSAVTQTTDNVRLRYFDSLLNSIATLTAAINETTELAADLTATATLDTVYTRVRYQASSLTAQASLAFDPEDRLRDQSAALSAQATLTADAINLEGTRVAFAATATLSCDAEKRIVSGANLTAQFTQISTAFKVVFAQANLPVVASQLSVIDIINFDPFLIFVVPAETRSIRVRPESREFIVEQESREIRVKSETREYLVPQSTNEKLTQGSPL